MCLSVREDIFETTRMIFTNFFVHVGYDGHGSVLHWHRCDTLFASGLVDDIMFFIVGRIAV